MKKHYWTINKLKFLVTINGNLITMSYNNQTGTVISHDKGAEQLVIDFVGSFVKDENKYNKFSKFNKIISWIKENVDLSK